MVNCFEILRFNSCLNGWFKCWIFLGLLILNMILMIIFSISDCVIVNIVNGWLIGYVCIVV